MSLLILIHYRKSFPILKHRPWFRKKAVSQCRKWVIPYLYTLRRTIAYAYIIPNFIAYLNTCIPYLNTWTTQLNTLSRLPILIHVLPIFIHALPILIQWLGFWLHILIHWTYTTRLGSQSESSTREPSALGSQLESSITSPESSRLGWRSLLGSL